MFDFIGNCFSTVWSWNMRLHSFMFGHRNPFVRVAKAFGWALLVNTVIRINVLAGLALIAWNFFTVVIDTIIDLA